MIPLSNSIDYVVADFIVVFCLGDAWLHFNNNFNDLDIYSHFLSGFQQISMSICVCPATNKYEIYLCVEILKLSWLANRIESYVSYKILHLEWN